MIVTTLLLNNYSIQYGESVVAGFGVALRIVQVPEFLSMGLFLGLIPLFAHNYSSNNINRLHIFRDPVIRFDAVQWLHRIVHQHFSGYRPRSSDRSHVDYPGRVVYPRDHSFAKVFRTAWRDLLYDRNRSDYECYGACPVYSV
ncbi:MULTISPECIES: hypothetical protein [Paenibacillus]|uniref:hypothetical protein n=1 Tax=Paenibacillus TaxID=44249 RepID=UPI000B0ED908|nr:MULTISPECIES: hypothetical protein [Paenibacillus]